MYIGSFVRSLSVPLSTVQLGSLPQKSIVNKFQDHDDSLFLPFLRTQSCKTMTWHLDMSRVFQTAGGGFSGQVGPRRGAARRALAGKIQGSGAASAAGKSGGWQVLLGLVRAKAYPQLGTPGARFGWTRLKPTCAVWQRSALACEGGPGWDGEGVRGERNWTLKEEGVQENLNKKTQCFPYQKCGFNFWETSHPKIWVRYGSWYSFPWRLQKQIPQKS